MNTEEQIKEIIKKNLPQEVGEVLKARLEQADKEAKTIIELEKSIQTLRDSNTDYYKLVEKYKAFDERNFQLDKREASLNKLQHDLDLELLQNKLDNEVNKSEFAKSVALGLVRNTHYRNTIFDSETLPPYYSNGNYVQPTPVNKHHTEDKTAE